VKLKFPLGVVMVGTKSILLRFLAGILLASPASAATATWDASTGLLPDAVSPPWSLFDTAVPEDPSFAASTSLRALLP
jgi:hypothetical protein